MAGQINLYDPALKRKRDWLTLGNILLGTAVMLSLVLVAGIFVRSGLAELHRRLAASETRLNALRAQVLTHAQAVEQRKTDVRLERELAATRQLLEMRGLVLQTLRQRLAAQAQGFADPLRGLANLTMPGVWITGFVWNAASNDMEIRGRTTDPALLPEYVSRLNREPALRGQAFAALNIEEGKPERDASGMTTAPRLPPFYEFILVPVRRETTAPGAGEGGRG